MEEQGKTSDLYAGDAAWQEWFDICSVDGCEAAHAEKLRAQVTRAMYARLARLDISREEAGADDPVAFFDSYFKLKGTRDKKKPLKSYFAYRMKVEGRRMVDFVCGTLFGAAAGRIHDIVLEWVSSIKGWKARSFRDSEGRRHTVFERPLADDTAAPEASVTVDPAAYLDIRPMMRTIDRALTNVARKINLEKHKVASLLLMTARDLSLNGAGFLEAMNMSKSGAYAARDKAMKALKRELEHGDGVGTPLFGRVLLATCEAAVPESLRATMGGAE